MAILFVTHKFPPSIGGMQKQIYELINGVRKYTKVYTIAIRPTENKMWFLLRLKSRIKSMLRAHPNIKIVHCNDGVTASFCQWLVGIEDVKVTATLHGLDVVFPNGVFQNRILPKLHHFDKIYCVSQATAEACLQRGFDKSKLEVIHNGIDTSLQNIEMDKTALLRLQTKYKIDFDKQKIILAVGRAVKRKGFSWFISHVLPDVKNATFIMVGPIQNKVSLFEKFLNILPQWMKTQIELMLGYPSDSAAIQVAMSTAKNAIHLSNIPFDDLMDIYSLSSLFIMPNVSVDGDMEGFGLVALEAVMRGCPVVAADIEGIQDAVSHNHNGILLPSGKGNIWSAEINLLLEDADRMKAVANRAIRYTKDKYSWEKMCHEYWASFQALSFEQKAIPIKDMVLA